MDCSALEAATLYERLNKDPALWWCIVGVDFPAGGAKPTAFIQYEGGSTLDDLVSHLSDDAIQYGCFKVLGVDTKGAITSTRTKFVRLSLPWSAPPAPPSPGVRPLRLPPPSHCGTPTLFSPPCRCVSNGAAPK